MDEKKLTQEELAAMTRQRDQRQGVIHKINATIAAQPQRANRHDRRAASVLDRRAARKAEKALTRAAVRERQARSTEATAA